MKSKFILQGAMWGVALVVALVAGGVLHGCPHVREGVMRATPTVPPRVECAEGQWQCSGALPQRCSESGRWWPMLPRNPDGVQRLCAARCVVDDTAHCSGEEVSQ